jgi:hypothetical protein
MEVPGFISKLEYIKFYKEIIIIPDLSLAERIILSFIYSFNVEGKQCFISNGYIAQILGVKERQASGILNRLVTKGYVSVVHFNGRKRYIRCDIDKISDILESIIYRE